MDGLYRDFIQTLLKQPPISWTFHLATFYQLLNFYDQMMAINWADFDMSKKTLHGILQNFAHSLPDSTHEARAIIDSMDKVISLYQKHHLFMLHKLIKICP
jgi:hypothetical protein